MKKQVVFYLPASDPERFLFNDNNYRTSYDTVEEVETFKIFKESKVIKITYEWEQDDNGV